jgi:2-polyprenyl-3-methyl-5-hydroxy-6-metoxy-1,4-benzoquinol methylase
MTDRMTRFETPLQIMELDDISKFNRILDIGAGGEGLAARIGKEKVYGVDIRIDEIRELRSKRVSCN